ncbi:hypothetical protein [Natrinema sp. H-ect4]|uniref:DUF7344 domain-containing protein n=1 Tax=Natrinema sp. H-ect4 TaxID=3242699 RepID=UPI0035A89168
MSEESSTFDSVLNLCQHQHRRIVLGLLAEEQRSLTLNDLTQAVLKYNHQTSITEASEDVLTEIRLSLYHIHIPKLVSKGLINYDSERELVEPTEQFDQVQPTLSTILDADPTLEAPMTL